MKKKEERAGEVEFEPYARLISVLGDQLISDKWVGVIELVKNSYDADAENVKIIFTDFKDEKKKSNPQTIIVQDDGDGMKKETVLGTWMKPATPNKLNRKKLKDEKARRTKLGRAMQGDKGVGRFATYKLGDHVELFSKTKQTDEIQLILEFSKYANDDFDSEVEENMLLSQIKNKWQINSKPQQINNEKNQGTTIVIKKLRDEWKERDLNKLLKAFFRMTPPKLPGLDLGPVNFTTEVYWGDELKKGPTKNLDAIIEMAPFYFEGTVSNNGTLEYSYQHEKRKEQKKINFFEDHTEIVKHNIWGLKFFRENFLLPIDENKKLQKDNLKVGHRPNFGQIMFFLYAFDWKNPIEGLTTEEKKTLQENSVFLFRDNMRVFPYGERGVDWLMLSKYRAEDKAGNYFSYNDLIGFVFITQQENPLLRDAADREGLMNIKGAYDDFVAIMQATLKVMKDEVDKDKAKSNLRKKKVASSYSKRHKEAYDAFEKKIMKTNDKELIDSSTKYFQATNSLINKFRDDLKISQELAGTGMVVEKATHDTMSLLKRLRENTSDFVKKLLANELEKDEIRAFLKEMEESLEFLYQELQVLQPLFRVARKITKDVHVKDIAERITKYFRKEIDGKISVTIEDDDFTVRTNTGLILQVLLNLMDNSIFWLNESIKEGNREIKIQIDADKRTLIFADNGPGIDEDLKEIIFTEFFTRKAEGRGLGLYIAAELLERIGAKISVITHESDKVLNGANFLIEFAHE